MHQRIPFHTINNSASLYMQRGDPSVVPAKARPEVGTVGFAAIGDEEHLYSGSDDLYEVGWYEENSELNGKKQTRPVGQKKANGFGLYDMSGNVSEWCPDTWGDYSRRSGGDSSCTVDPHHTRFDNPGHVLCRGSWLDRAMLSCSSFGDTLYPPTHDSCMGFRMLRTKK